MTLFDDVVPDNWGLYEDVETRFAAMKTNFDTMYASEESCGTLKLKLDPGSHLLSIPGVQRRLKSKSNLGSHLLSIPGIERR